MKELQNTFTVKIYENSSELSTPDNLLITLATKMLDHAYAPYSNFHVGSAARLTNGESFVGCNQENASYPLCMCGERVALYNAGANQPLIPVEALAIVVRNLKMPVLKPASPCGACRQVIYEFEMKHKHPIRILLKADGPEIYEIPSAADLLPLGFNDSYL